MRHSLPGLLVGVLFGAGLALSGMTDPARVLGFLDVAGKWDPTLAFVLAAALVPSSLAYLLVRRMERPVMAEEFCIPQNRAIETRLGDGLSGKFAHGDQPSIADCADWRAGSASGPNSSSRPGEASEACSRSWPYLTLSGCWSL